MSEARALTAAGAGHLALFAVLSLSWSLLADEPLVVAEEPISVEFVEIADAPAVTERPEPSLAAAPRELVEAPPELQPLEEVTPQELPELKPAETPPPPRPEPAPEPKPEPKPAPPKKQELDAPIDRSKEIAQRAREEEDFARAITEALPTKAALSSIQQNTLRGLIRDRIYKCWDPNAGGPDSSKIVTTLRVKAAPSGKILGTPTVLKQTGSAASGYLRVARDAAIRAVLNPRCSLEGLPEELYEGGWEDFTLNFDPKDL